MLSWEEYIKHNILEFRNRYKKHSEKYRKWVEKDRNASRYSLTKPSQVVVIDFNKPYPECFIILHNKKRPDMETIVFENVKFDDFSSKALKEPRLLELLGSREIEQFLATVRRYVFDSKWDRAFDRLGESFYLLNRGNFRSKPNDFAIWVNTRIRIYWLEAQRELQRKKIEKTVDKLRRDAEAIPEGVQLRNKIIESTQRLEGQIKQQDEQYSELRDDLVGVHKLVATKGYGEWKALLSDIDKINTRIDAMSDVRSAYDKVLSQQIEFMKQQSEVMEKQSSFMNWIKYAMVFVPIAVIIAPIVEYLIRLWTSAP